MAEPIFTVEVDITSFDGVRQGERGVNLIGFRGRVDSPVFKGETVGTGYDTQKYSEAGFSLSARYLLKGTDENGAPCSVFIENNGSDMANCVPEIVTDSPALAAFLDGKSLRAEVLPRDGGVSVKIFG